MYRIGQLAAACQISTDTLRFYEKQGLLLPSERSESGYRLYNEADKHKLNFILRSKSVGFSLNEAKELLCIDSQKADWRCQDVKQKVDLKITDINQKIEELEKFKSSLTRISQLCCGGAHSAEHCTILEALES